MRFTTRSRNPLALPAGLGILALLTACGGSSSSSPAGVVAPPTGTANVLVTDLGEVEVTPEEVIVSERPREGWSVVNEQGETVALDLELSPELLQAGLAREVIRGVQEARKSSGFAVSDRIHLRWAATADATAAAIRTHAGLIGDEVLATTLTESEPAGDWFSDDDLGLRFAVSVVDPV